MLMELFFVHSIGQSADGDFLKSIRAIANGSSYYPKEVRTMAGYVKVSNLQDYQTVNQKF